MADKNATLVAEYRRLIHFMVQTKSFRGYSTLDYIKEKIAKFDPDCFKDENEFEAYMASRKEKE